MNVKITGIAEQQHELGLGEAAPLRYAASPSRLC